MRTTNALLVMTALLLSSATASAERARRADEVSRGWQLLVDDAVVASKQNVQRRYHGFQKHAGNPLISVDRPWENDVVAAQTVLPAESGEGFRMYYYCWTQKDDPQRSYICYATSKDGLKWEKPDLGLHEWVGNKSKQNNIVPNGAGAVMPTAWAGPDSQYHGVGGRYHAKASADGLHWRSLSEESIVSGGDTSHFYWDDRTKKFRCNVKVIADITGLRRRCVGFSETEDLTKYPPLRLVMAPDDIDDRWCKPGTVERTHFYACPVFPYGSSYLGLLQIYRAEDPEGYFHGPLWLELVSSRDGMHWTREEQDRPPLLDLGKFRTFDHGMVFAPPPLIVGDEIWLYYTGYDELHDLLPYKSAIGLAKLRLDGFGSLDADEAPGEVITKRLVNAAGPLQVNCDARGGALRVEVLDESGKVIPGYGRQDCIALTGSVVRGKAIWNGHDELPAGSGPIRLRFIMDRVRLYSFNAGDTVQVMEEDKPPLAALFTFEGETEAWSDMLSQDGAQVLRNLGTCTLDHKEPSPAFGERSLVVGSPWRPWNRVEIDGTRELGRQFTLAAAVKSKNNKHARLFSAYNGNFPTNTTELIFDFDPRGRVLNGMRLFCKGTPVESESLKFDDSKYHHLAVVFNNGQVDFYLDGKPAGQAWLPGGEPVVLARNLLVGEDANMGSDEQLQGNVDDVLVLGRALSSDEIGQLARDGAAAFFKLKD